MAHKRLRVLDKCYTTNFRPSGHHTHAHTDTHTDT